MTQTKKLSQKHTNTAGVVDISRAQPQFDVGSSAGFDLLNWETLYKLKSTDCLYLVDNDQTVSFLRQLGFKALNRYRLRQFSNDAFEKATKCVVTRHDCQDRQQSYQLAKALANQTDRKGNVIILDPFKGDPLPFSRGKGLGDLLAEFAGNNRNIENAVHSLHIDGVVWEWVGIETVDPSFENSGAGFEIELMPVGWSEGVDHTKSLFIWDGTVPRGGLALLCGLPKAGKTTLAERLAVAVSNGEPFLGRDTTQGRVLYFAFQGSGKVIRQQITAAGGRGDRILVHSAKKPQTIKDAIEGLTEAIVSTDPILVVIDMLSKVLRTENENAYMLNDQALEQFGDLAERTDAGFLLLHHNNRSDEYLGSTSIFGGVDCMLQLKKDRNKRRVLTSEQRIGEEFPATLIKLDKETGQLTGESMQTKARGGDKISKICSQILIMLRDQPATKHDIESRLQLSGGDFTKAKDFLKQSGQVLESGSGKKGNPYVYLLSDRGADAEKQKARNSVN